ncbi:MAG: hypothetical protein WBH31_03825 [Promethearchaeia archaeon]
MILISQLNWEILEIFYLVIIFLSGFFVTYAFIPYLMKLMRKKRYLGYDIHKNTKPEIPESGGLSLILGLTVTSLISIIFFPVLRNELLVFLLTILLSGAIGFIDDRIKLRSLYKILLTIFTGVVIFVANFFGFITIHSPTIPFLGFTRLTRIYPFVAPLIVAFFANTSNMLEGYNGEGSGTSLIALFFILICAIIWNSAEALIFIISGISVLIPFFLYNKFPAKIFPGDVGTLGMGSLFACIALLGSLEVVVFCALLIQVINSFYVISSVKGFLESSEIQTQKNDIILLEDDRIKASDQKDAALTLPRLILAKGPLKEPELIKQFYIISIICGIFSITAFSSIQWTLSNLDNLTFFLLFMIFLVLIILISYFFPRIRGTVILMIVLLGIISISLIFINSVIMSIFQEDINLGIIIVPSNILFSILLVTPGLILWYLLTIKFFWREIDKMKELET